MPGCREWVPLNAIWRSHLPAVVTEWDEYVVDLRSASYATFVAVPGALTARVVTEMPDGRRKVVSHFSKFHRGLLARALAVSRAEIDSRAAVLRVARAAGLRIEPLGRDAIQMVTAAVDDRNGMTPAALTRDSWPQMCRTSPGRHCPSRW